MRSGPAAAVLAVARFTLAVDGALNYPVGDHDALCRQFFFFFDSGRLLLTFFASQSIISLFISTEIIMYGTRFPVPKFVCIEETVIVLL